MKKTISIITAVSAFFVIATASTPVYRYGQCGGIGYTGSKICASPYTCIKINDHYSQCQ